MKITTTNAPQIVAQLRAAGILVSRRPFNSGGNGGQHGNRTFNAVELIAEWTVDGRPLRVSATAGLKSQHVSLAAALRILFSKRDAALRELARPDRGTTQGFGGAGQERVRTYHALDNRVVDSSGVRASYRETVGREDLSTLIDGRRERLQVTT